MIIRNNRQAQNANRNLGINNTGISQNLEKLSTGLRINRAADDAAGLAISEKTRGQIRGLSMAESNVEHGIELVQTAEGGMEEIVEMIQRQRELMVQAANGTYTESDLDKLQAEIDHLTAEISDMARKTNYNNIPLLNNSIGRVNLGPISGPELNSDIIPPHDTLNYFEDDGNLPNQFSFNTRLEIKNGAGEEIGLTYDPLTGEKGYAEVDGVDWKKGDVLEFRLAFEVDVDPLPGRWLVAPDNYYNIPGAMTPGSTHQPAFTPAPPIAPPTYSPAVTSNPRWVASVPSRTIYPDITIRSPGYPDQEGSFEVTWEGSLGLPASLKCTACGGSPCTCGAIPEGFRDRIKIEPNPTAYGATSTTLKVTIDGDFLHVGDDTHVPESGGLTHYTLPNYDGLWDVEIVNESPQTYNTGVITYNAYQSYSNVLPGHPLWTFSPPDSNHYNAVWNGTGYDYTPIPYSTTVNLSALPSDHPLYVASINSSPYVATHHHVNVAGGESYLNVAVDRPERNIPIQSGANVDDQINLTLYDARTYTLGLTDFWSDTKIGASTPEEASVSLELLDSALNIMVSYRAIAGAEQNRLEHAQNNLGTSKENLIASESTIRDLDMAREVMKLAKNQILSQSSQTMLAQAQQLPQGVLSFLK